MSHDTFNNFQGMKPKRKKMPFVKYFTNIFFKSQDLCYDVKQKGAGLFDMI